MVPPLLKKATVTDKVTKWDGGVPNNVDKK